MKNLSKEELLSRMEAINRSNAIIYFDLNGFILGVNAIFLKAMGFQEDEHDKLIGKHHSIFVSYEYSKTYDKTNEPYYPINDESNNLVYKKYKDYSESFKNIIIGGRLGNYRYYDMDMSIGNALAALKKEFAGFNP